MNSDFRGGGGMAKMSFSVDRGFSVFENGWVGADGSASEAVNGCRQIAASEAARCRWRTSSA